MDELLQSNNPPLHFECIHLESLIGDSHVFLSGLKDQITQTCAVLEGLLDEERSVERLVQSCKTILSPIRNIPEDRVHRILVTCLDIDKPERKDSLDGKSPPLVLSQVCRDWRSVTLSTSQLWSSISLDFDRYRNEVACLYRLQMYILRSGMHDITLSIRSTKGLSTKNPVTPILFSSAARWVDLHIAIPYLSLHALSAVRGSLHRLTRLRVEFTTEPRMPLFPPSKPIFRAFEYAPLLRSVSINSVCSAVEQVSLPWPQLTQYTGNDWTSTYIDILKLAPDMASMSLQCDDDCGFDIVLPSIPFRHHGLRRLHVYEEAKKPRSEIRSEGGITHVLSHVELPALESLSMAYRHPNIWIPSSLHLGNLSSLSIDASFIIPTGAQADLLSLLRTTPSLSHLSMSMSMAPEEDVILVGLNISINPDVVPGLKSLAFRFINISPGLSSVFVDMVESRRPGLESLRLSVPLVMLPPPSALVDRWAGLCDGNFVTYGVE
ncbi:uncharacterized protein EV420DRAFT_1704971 [Desarmillaria tabescens]|uniref:F-box domain-containing protein n=1 Tax=Armillaria tabescens TaxID=1929756 RepID=A0AA39JXE4_ARMTA|nr:uncharacterized protein EV420DRAFT_1704971 [Desarmillaria tabescens]KAK0450503.1 hypothetical protein EV420DRAFT_1704971 [Desarmillaria tabescens]